MSVMNLVRNGIGKMIVWGDALTAPTPLTRDAAAQKQIDMSCAALAVYELENCPFCIKVRREMRRLALPIARRDIGKSEQFKNELLAGGKEYQAPCLRITETNGSVRWMYESDDIIAYLRGRFGST